MDRDIQDKGYWEVADEIRAMTWSKTPAIILMSDKAEHFLQNVHKQGIDAIMPKPFFFSTFRTIVDELGLTKDGEGTGSVAMSSNPLGGLRFLVAEDNAINADAPETAKLQWQCIAAPDRAITTWSSWISECL